ATIELQETDPDSFDKYGDELDNDQIRFEEARSIIVKAIASASNGQTRNSNDQTNPRTVRINDSLKPEVLGKDATPIEMRQWTESFEAYYASNRMDTFTIKERQSYFKILLDTELRRCINSKINAETDIFGTNGCIAMLEQDFKVRYPIFTRRLDYFQCRMKEGEHFTDFWARLKEMGKLADVNKLSAEEINVFRGICGCADKELLDEFLKLKEKTEETIEETAKIHEGKLSSRAKLNPTQAIE
ncbi:Hypothetical predicted protein, partial [Paramuricea clavata]